MRLDGSTPDEMADVSGETDDVELGSEAPEQSDADPGEAGPSDDVADSSLPPRDDAGRFTRSKSNAKRDLLSTEPSPADEAAGETTDREAGTTEGPDGAAEETAAAPAAAKDGAPETPLTTEPWSVASDRESHTVEGAIRVAGKGVLIPESHMGNVERLISRGLRYEKQWREIREMQEALKSQASAPPDDVVEAKALLAELKPLLDPANTEALIAFLENPTQNIESLEARVEKAVLAAKLERAEQAQRATRESIDSVDSQEAMATEFRAAFDRIAEHPQFKGKLDGDDLKAAWQKLNRYHQRFFRAAETDMPEYGIRAGETILEQQVIIDELADRMQLRAALKAEKERAAAEAKKLAEATRRNAANLAAANPTRRGTAPVTRRTTGTPAPREERRLTAREAKRALLDTSIDD